MAMLISKRIRILILATSLVMILLSLALPSPSLAVMSFASATGQPCSKCHISPTGDSQLNAFGQVFAAVPTHDTDPAGAFAVATQNPISPAITGSVGDDTVAYLIMVRNTGTTNISNVFVAGTIPNGSSFASVVATPAGGTFVGSQGGAAAWLIGSVPAGGSVGPFVYTISRGTATDVSAIAFVHWTIPKDATAISPRTVPK